jgi:integrase
MRGLMYTTQCTKSHIYLYFLEYVQEIFGIEQDKEGLDLLRIIDTKKVTAIVAANVRKPVNHIYLGKLQKICIHALTDKTMEEEDRIVSAVLLLLIYTGRRIGEVLHTEIQAVQYTSYGEESIPYIMMPLEKRTNYMDRNQVMDVTKNAGKPLALAMGMDRRCRDFA